MPAQKLKTVESKGRRPRRKRALNKVYVKKSDQGYQLPGTESLTPTYWQEPVDRMQICDPAVIITTQTHAA